MSPIVHQTRAKTPSKANDKTVNGIKTGSVFTNMQCHPLAYQTVTQLPDFSFEPVLHYLRHRRSKVRCGAYRLLETILRVSRLPEFNNYHKHFIIEDGAQILTEFLQDVCDIHPLLSKRSLKLLDNLSDSINGTSALTYIITNILWGIVNYRNPAKFKKIKGRIRQQRKKLKGSQNINDDPPPYPNKKEKKTKTNKTRHIVRFSDVVLEIQPGPSRFDEYDDDSLSFLDSEGDDDLLPGTVFDSSKPTNTTHRHREAKPSSNSSETCLDAYETYPSLGYDETDKELSSNDESISDEMDESIIFVETIQPPIRKEPTKTVIQPSAVTIQPPVKEIVRQPTKHTEKINKPKGKVTKKKSSGKITSQHAGIIKIERRRIRDRRARRLNLRMLHRGTYEPLYHGNVLDPLCIKTAMDTVRRPIFDEFMNTLEFRSYPPKVLNNTRRLVLELFCKLTHPTMPYNVSPLNMTRTQVINFL
ncbi:unnamed protein product [Nezara viridula]|uniref:Uncharacterized protein n=1 Tax=Nezara viridula TaxID=85310 RepID=A0A9P0EGD3_NEZVI|nr:unnamed protein product [Nezara viridula]